MKTFKDAEFMSAEDKDLVLKAWRQFIRSEYKKNNFTDRLYKHLTLHCSFIAHYDINGFYDYYFQNPRQTLRFLAQFNRKAGAISVESGYSRWLNDSDYLDLNNEMCAIVEENLSAQQAKLNEKDRMSDLAIVKSLVRKHRFSIEELQ